MLIKNIYTLWGLPRVLCLLHTLLLTQSYIPFYLILCGIIPLSAVSKELWKLLSNYSCSVFARLLYQFKITLLWFFIWYHRFCIIEDTLSTVAVMKLTSSSPFQQLVDSCQLGPWLLITHALYWFHMNHALYHSMRYKQHFPFWITYLDCSELLPLITVIIDNTVCTHWPSCLSLC